MEREGHSAGGWPLIMALMSEDFCKEAPPGFTDTYQNYFMYIIANI
jgi:hypothetical protein